MAGGRRSSRRLLAWHAVFQSEVALWIKDRALFEMELLHSYKALWKSSRSAGVASPVVSMNSEEAS